LASRAPVLVMWASLLSVVRLYSPRAYARFTQGPSPRRSPAANAAAVRIPSRRGAAPRCRRTGRWSSYAPLHIGGQPIELCTAACVTLAPIHREPGRAAQTARSSADASLPFIGAGGHALCPQVRLGIAGLHTGGLSTASSARLDEPRRSHGRTTELHHDAHGLDTSLPFTRADRRGAPAHEWHGCSVAQRLPAPCPRVTWGQQRWPSACAASGGTRASATA